MKKAHGWLTFVSQTDAANEQTAIAPNTQTTVFRDDPYPTDWCETPGLSGT